MKTNMGKIIDNSRSSCVLEGPNCVGLKNYIYSVVLVFDVALISLTAFTVPKWTYFVFHMQS